MLLVRTMSRTFTLIKCAICDEKTNTATHLFTFDEVSVAVCLSCRDKHAGRCQGCDVWRFKDMLMEQVACYHEDECDCKAVFGIFCGFKHCNQSLSEDEGQIGRALKKNGWAVGFTIIGDFSYEREDFDEKQLTTQIIELLKKD